MAHVCVEPMPVKRAQPGNRCAAKHVHFNIKARSGQFFFEAFLPINLFYVKGKRQINACRFPGSALRRSVENREGVGITHA